jgi:Asp-tRNA(Asn)/Glu-tRNA(Gln) amidotransferase A subunit family amidase
MISTFSTITDLAAAIDAGTVDPAELAQAALVRVDALDPVLNAYVALRREEALAEAEAARSRWRDKTRRGPLGIPVALKDNFDIAGMPTGNGFANGNDLPA